jgi:HSP20 family molecular chaperone IbpA
VALPKAVDGNKAEASFDKGILKIIVPKKKEVKPRKVTIKPTTK